MKSQRVGRVWATNITWHWVAQLCLGQRNRCSNWCIWCTFISTYSSCVNGNKLTVISTLGRTPCEPTGAQRATAELAPEASLGCPPVPTLGSAQSALGLEPECRSQLCSPQLFNLETDFSFFQGEGLLRWNGQRTCHSYLVLVVFLIWVTHPHPQPSLAILLVESTAVDLLQTISSQVTLSSWTPWVSPQQVKWQGGGARLVPWFWMSLLHQEPFLRARQLSLELSWMLWDSTW